MTVLQRMIRSRPLAGLRGAGRDLASRWPHPVSVQLGGGRRLFVDLRSAIGRGMLVTGQFDPALTDLIREVLSPGDTFIDVGANVGVFSVIASDLVTPTGTVHAFEVDPRSLRCLRRTQRSNRLGNLIVHAHALGDEVAISALRQTGELGHTYLAPGDTGHSRFPVLPLDTWSSYFAKIGVRAMKIDVEGAELEVLRGARRVIESCRPIVIAESVETHLQRFQASEADVVRFMDGLGYKMEILAGANDRTIVFR